MDLFSLDWLTLHLKIQVQLWSLDPDLWIHQLSRTWARFPPFPRNVSSLVTVWVEQLSPWGQKIHDKHGAASFTVNPEHLPRPRALLRCSAETQPSHSPINTLGWRKMRTKLFSSCSVLTLSPSLSLSPPFPGSDGAAPVLLCWLSRHLTSFQTLWHLLS